MTAIRFASVSYFYNLPKKTVQGLAGPNNRVLFFEHKDASLNLTKTYLVTGSDDIAMVDQLLDARQRYQQQKDEIAAQEMNNALYRFLSMKAHNVEVANTYLDRWNKIPATIEKISE